MGAFGGASNHQANGVASEDGKSMPFPRVTFAQSLEFAFLPGVMVFYLQVVPLVWESWYGHGNILRFP